MPEYLYRAQNRQGKVTKGSIKAPSIDRANAMLVEHGLVPLEVTDVRSQSIFNREFSIQRVGVRDRAIMARQLATMVEAGIPLLQALKILMVQTENGKLADILREVSFQVEGGEALSNALEKFPTVFSEFFVSMVRSGEASGRLTDVMNQLAINEEKGYELVRKVRGALIYPIFVITLMIILGIIVILFVLPQLTDLFKETGVQLPLPTRILLGVGTFARGYWWFVLLFLGLVGYLFSTYIRTPEGRYNLHAFVLRIPVFGDLLKKLYLAQFSAALKTLIQSEVPVIRALLVSRNILGNRVYQKIIDETVEDVQNGSTISASLERFPQIPLMVSQMISVGERSGKLGKSLEAVFSFYQRDVDEKVQNFSQLIEPLIIVLLGVGVAGLLLAVLMPIYQLVNVIS